MGLMRRKSAERPAARSASTCLTNASSSPGLRRPSDQATDDRPTDDRADREHDEEQAAEDGTDGDARLRAARHLALDLDRAVVGLGHDGGVLQRDPAVRLEGAHAAQRRHGVVGRIEGDGYQFRHRVPPLAFVFDAYPTTGVAPLEDAWVGLWWLVEPQEAAADRCPAADEGEEVWGPSSARTAPSVAAVTVALRGASVSRPSSAEDRVRDPAAAARAPGPVRADLA